MKSPEEGYALGWADAIYAYESKQRKNMKTPTGSAMSSLLPLPLPEPAYAGKREDYFTADQIRAYREACAAADREEFLKLVADDSWAITFQTLGQYRTALLAAIRARGETHG